MDQHFDLTKKPAQEIGMNKKSTPSDETGAIETDTDSYVVSDLVGDVVD